MKEGKKKHFRGFGEQLTSTISVAMVLLILGIVASLGAVTRSITDTIRQNLGFTIVMAENVDEAHVQQLKQRFTSAPYVASYTYMSSDDILKQEESLADFDIMEAVGVNPYQAEFGVRVKSEYANSDSIARIVSPIEQMECVESAIVHTDMVDDVNSNIKAISLVLFAVALALAVISFVLINNTVKLAIYSNRFILNTMQLVGATAAFIRRPILLRNIVNGVIAALLAIALLCGVRYFIASDPQAAAEIGEALPWEHLAVIFGCMILCGMILCGVAAYFATNKYLRRNYDDLF